MTKKQFKPKPRSLRPQPNGSLKDFQKVMSWTHRNWKDAYRLIDTSWLSLRIRPFKPGMVHSFMVIFTSPLSKQEVEDRMCKAFGDLAKNKETI